MNEDYLGLRLAIQLDNGNESPLAVNVDILF
jgi:hypothetical protein